MKHKQNKTLVCLNKKKKKKKKKKKGKKKLPR